MKMSMNTDYLPEWIIYLWKKLLLNKSDQFNGKLEIENFQFFTREEQKAAQKQIFLKNMSVLKIAAKTRSLIDTSTQLIQESQTYFHFNPLNVFLMLFAGLSHKPAAAKVTDIHIDPAFLRIFQNTDPYKGLSRSVYTKITRADRLTVKEVFDLQAYPALFNYLTFNLTIFPRNLKRLLDKYLDAWTAGNFKSPKGVYYIDPEKQMNDFLVALGRLEKKFGRRLTINSEMLAKAGDWYAISELNYRFYETLFSLEKAGFLEIIYLIKEDVMIELKTAITKNNQFNGSPDKENLLITKRGSDYFYKGRLLKLSPKADYYKVFSALYTLLGHGGEIEYGRLGREIQSRVPKTKRYGKSQMQKFIQTNLTDRSNGFIHYAEIPATEDNSKPLISVKRGIGIVFNNIPS